MSTTKKTPKDKAGKTIAKPDPSAPRNDDSNAKSNDVKENGRARRVNYVVKDLPIY